MQAVLDNDAGWLPPFSCFSHRSEERRKPQTTVVYLVRSSRAYARIRSLTTGTFNRVVKDRSAIRLSGAHSVQANSIYCEPAYLAELTGTNPTVLETLQTYSAAKIRSTSGAHRISRCFPHLRTPSLAGCGRAAGKEVELGSTYGQQCPYPHFAVGLKNCAQQYEAFRSAKNVSNHADFGACRSGRQKLRKDPSLEVLALKVPFGKLLLRRSRIRSRGRDNLKA